MPPPYHLRPNKAVDRHLFMESIRFVVPAKEMSSYKYFCMGGPFLEDCRLFHEFFPNTRMVSIEELDWILERQKFNKPCRTIELVHSEIGDFIDNYFSGNERSIFWLDYTGLESDQISEFQQLLGKVEAGSVVKVSVQSEPNRYIRESRKNGLKEEFEEFLPSPGVKIPAEIEKFGFLLQQMFEIASQRALAGFDLCFQPISSFVYRDGTGMFTLTGVVVEEGKESSIKETLKPWKYKNTDWAIEPKLINVPVLTTKERQSLQALLPTVKRDLVKSLGFKVEDDDKENAKIMEQYADFYVQYPYFVKGVP